MPLTRAVPRHYGVAESMKRRKYYHRIYKTAREYYASNDIFPYIVMNRVSNAKTASMRCAKREGYLHNTDPVYRADIPLLRVIKPR